MLLANVVVPLVFVSVRAVVAKNIPIDDDDDDADDDDEEKVDSKRLCPALWCISFLGTGNIIGDMYVVYFFIYKKHKKKL